MYLQHFGLNEPPFSITPDPRFVFLGERHRDALAHLTYGIGQGGGGGFVQLTGEVGTGKTTLSRLLLEQLPGHARVALVLNPRLTPVELLETACEELGIDIEGRRGSLKPLVDALNAYLLDAYARGLRIVLIVDEAQNLPLDTLEQVRLLTNLETPTQKLLQVILIGQPELRDMLARQEMRQLAQRITARFHLTPLDASETGDYLRHRFAVAGGMHSPFTDAAVARIHARTGGIPRLVNVVAERALLAGYVQERTVLDESVIDRAADEALGAPSAGPIRQMRREWITTPRLAIAATVAVLGFGLFAWLRLPAGESPGAVAAPSAAATDDPARSLETASAAMPTSLDEAGFDAALRAAGLDDAPAWLELMRLWRLPADRHLLATLRGCTPVPMPGLHCARGRSSLDALLAADRPAILHLQAPDGAAAAVLLGVERERARLWLDGRLIDLPLGALASRWAGDYTMLWSASQLHSLELVPGGAGPGIDWLRARLGYAGPAVFDDGLEVALRQYQRSQGLLPDGIPGPATRAALAAADAGPQLQRTTE